MKVGRPDSAPCFGDFLPVETSHITISFQQELRSQLLAIERKLDVLAQRAERSHAGSGASWPPSPHGRQQPRRGEEGLDRQWESSAQAQPGRVGGSYLPLGSPAPPSGLEDSDLLLRGRRPSPTPSPTPSAVSQHISLPHTNPADDLEVVNLDSVPHADPDGVKASPVALSQAQPESGSMQRWVSSITVAVPLPQDSQNVHPPQEDEVVIQTVGHEVQKSRRRLSASSSSTDGARVGCMTKMINIEDSSRAKGRDMYAASNTNSRSPADLPKRVLSSVFSSERVVKRAEAAQGRPLWRFVHGVPFNIATSAMILLNVLFIGFIADDRLKAGLHRRAARPEWDYVDLGFCVFFAGEILLRFLADKILFFFSGEWRWNIFDLLLVCFSITDLALSRMTDVDLSNLTMARVLRFIRFVRVVRIARAVRAFHSLRVVVFAVFESIVSLMWCFIVVGLIIYMFAILFLYGITEYVTSEGQGNDAVIQALLPFYASVPSACYALFMTISGGIDWHDAMEPLVDVHWTFQPLFTFYVFVMVIGVMNVVMGAFVAATAEIAKRDRDVLVKNEMREFQTYTEKIRTFFGEADKDKSGLLSWEEFEQHLEVPQVAAYFRALELDVSQAHILFRLLDRDGNNEVSLNEFLAGCMRLKGQAKSLEVNMLLYENKCLYAKLKEFMQIIDENFIEPGKSPQGQSG